MQTEGGEEVVVSREAAIRFLRHEDTLEDRTALKEALVATQSTPSVSLEEPENECICFGEREEAPPEPDPECPVHGICKPPSEGEEGEEGWPLWLCPNHGPLPRMATALAFSAPVGSDSLICAHCQEPVAPITVAPRDSLLTKEQWVDGLTSPRAVAAARRAYERALGANPDDNFRAALIAAIAAFGEESADA